MSVGEYIMKNCHEGTKTLCFIKEVDNLLVPWCLGAFVAKSCYVIRSHFILQWLFRLLNTGASMADGASGCSP